MIFWYRQHSKLGTRAGWRSGRSRTIFGTPLPDMLVNTILDEEARRGHSQKWSLGPGGGGARNMRGMRI